MNQTEIDELRERIDAAISTVCNGMAAMSIPADPRDVDLVLADCAKALAALEEARDERDRARQKIQAMEEQAMADEDGMSMRPLDGRLRKVEAERDALKATLAKHAESERAWCELATERGAKLEALESSLAEMAVKLDEGIECYPSSPCNIFATLLELHGLWRGKPSARVQP